MMINLIRISCAMIFTFCAFNPLYAQKLPSILKCECIEKINNDYLTDDEYAKIAGEKIKWTGFKNSTPMRNKIFVNINSDSPQIKSITSPYKYFPDGEVNEFEGKVIHRQKSFVMLKWDNEPWGNKVWIAAIDLTKKKAIVTESYKGITSFGINIEILDCK